MVYIRFELLDIIHKKLAAVFRLRYNGLMPWCACPLSLCAIQKQRLVCAVLYESISFWRTEPCTRFRSTIPRRKSSRRSTSVAPHGLSYILFQLAAHTPSGLDRERPVVRPHCTTGSCIAQMLASAAGSILGRPGSGPPQFGYGFSHCTDVHATTTTCLHRMASS